MAAEPFEAGPYRFFLTDQHMSKEEIHRMKSDYDVLGSETLKTLQSLIVERNIAKPDLYALLCENHEANPVLHRFWQSTHDVPDWVDWAQLERGQRFYNRYAIANLLGFALQGFLGENTSSASTAEVLVRTGSFSTRVLLRRLLETFQWLLQVTKDVESIKPGGAGHVSTVRVRLLHSRVRNRILTLLESKPEYFDTDKFGIPANISDSIHSIATFCCNPIWLQLPFIGIQPSAQETADFIALFQYLGWLLATPPEYFSSPERAKTVMESMLTTLEPTANGIATAHNFIECIRDHPPLHLSKGFIAAGARVLNGDSHCDAVNIEQPPVWYYAAFSGVCWLLRAVAALQHLIPAFDNWLTDFVPRFLYMAIVESTSHGFALLGGKPHDFSMKHEPRLGPLTGAEARKAAEKDLRLIDRPIEMTGLAVFSIVSASLTALAVTVLFYIYRFGYGLRLETL